MGKFTGILIISDFDGTFTSPNPESYRKNIDEVERFKKDGGIFTFASGRDYHSFSSIEPDFVNIANAPVIMTNGARLYDINTKKYILDYLLNLPLFSQILDIIYEKFPDTGIRLSCENGLVSPLLNEILKEDLADIFMRNISVREMPVKELIESKEKVFKCVMVHDPEKLDCVRDIAEDFNNANNRQFCFTRSYSRGLEAVNVNASKGASAVKLREYLNHRDKTEYKLFAIGDYDNDLDMIKLADYGAAPENALEPVKESAKIHTVSCSDGAVADLIGIIGSEYI